MRYTIILLALILAACETSDKATKGITGSLENASGESVQLNQIKNNAAELIETVQTDENGNFAFAQKAGKFDFYTVVVGDQQIVLLTDSTENIKITGNAEDLLGTYNVKGSEHSGILREYYAGSSHYREQLDSIQQAFQAVAQVGTEEQRQELIDGFESVREDYAGYQIKFLEANSHSPACLSILGELNPEEHLDIFKKVQSGITDKFSDHLYYSMLSNQIAEAEKKMASASKLKPGSPAPEIELENPQGKVVPLSSLRGNVVLIDFWASWCKPCRVENPKVVKMYNEYKPQGFEIYGVSLDRDKGKWVEAIKQDGLTWPQVSDLQFWNSAAAQLYNVSSIPHTVLVDREGKIIASGLRGKALEDKVKESLAM